MAKRNKRWRKMASNNKMAKKLRKLYNVQIACIAASFAAQLDAIVSVKMTRSAGIDHVGGNYIKSDIVSSSQNK